MDITRYNEIMSEFDTLLNHGIGLSNQLIGTETPESHLSYADTIFTKLLCHAISLRKLSPSLSKEPEAELWDFPSTCAIARCLIEAYDVLGYIVLSNLGAEERDFRLLIWKLHDKQRRYKMLLSIHSVDPQMGQLHNDINKLQDRCTIHPWYKNVPKSTQKRIISGDAPSFLLSQHDRNAENNINNGYYLSSTMWLSQYVHTFPMALHQLFEFKAGTPDGLHMSSMPIQYSSGFMAKAIIGMASTFPAVNYRIPANEAEIFSRWCAVVENGVSLSPR